MLVNLSRSPRRGESPAASPTPTVTVGTRLGLATLDARWPRLGLTAAFASATAPITFAFNMPMKSSSLTNTNVQLWPFPYYASWFLARSQDEDANGQLPTSDTDAVTQTVVSLDHPPLISVKDGGYDYYPLATSSVLGNNQFCYFPSDGPGPAPGVNSTNAPLTSGGDCTGTGTATPYCCNGSPSTKACTTSGVTDANGNTTAGAQLPLSNPP